MLRKKKSLASFYFLRLWKKDIEIIDRVSQKNVMVTENIEGPSQKNVWGYQSKMKDPIAKNTKDNNTRRII